MRSNQASFLALQQFHCPLVLESFLHFFYALQRSLFLKAMILLHIRGDVCLDGQIPYVSVQKRAFPVHNRFCLAFLLKLKNHSLCGHAEGQHGRSFLSHCYKDSLETKAEKKGIMKRFLGIIQLTYLFIEPSFLFFWRTEISVEIKATFSHSHTFWIF